MNIIDNDIREMEDMNPLPEEEGGNLYLVNGAMTKLKDAGAFAKERTESTSEETEPQQPPDNRNRGGLRLNESFGTGSEMRGKEPSF